MNKIKTARATYLIRGNWTKQELKKQYWSFIEKYRCNMNIMTFDRWLVERGKVYVKVRSK